MGSLEHGKANSDNTSSSSASGSNEEEDTAGDPCRYRVTNKAGAVMGKPCGGVKFVNSTGNGLLGPPHSQPVDSPVCSPIGRGIPTLGACRPRVEQNNNSLSAPCPLPLPAAGDLDPYAPLCLFLTTREAIPVL